MNRNRLRFQRLLVLLIAGVVSACAQPRKAVDDLLDRIKGLPPEFAADLILQVDVIVNKLPRAEQVNLYEEAFRTAAHAELATPLYGTGHHTDTSPGVRVAASQKGLDSLTLQYRAMLRMKALDASRLQRMFRDMRPLTLQPQSCKEILRPDLHKWAAAVNLVYHAGFTSEERAKNKDIVFLEEQIRGITSPMQLREWRNIVSQVDPGALPRLSAAYDAAFAQVRGDWFSYEYAARDLGLGRTNASAYRDFVVAHMRGVRCGPKWPFRKDEEREEVARFNKFIARHEDLNLQPVDVAKLEPSRVEESAELEEFWKSEKSQRLLEELRWLTHGNRKLPDAERFWTLEERRSAEWNERYIGFLKLIDNWSAADERSPALYFFMRSRVWLSLVTLVPPGPQRTNAFRSTVAWLNSSFADRVVSRAEWWVLAKELLDLARKEPGLLDDLEQYGNPVLSLYAHVDNPRSTATLGEWAHQPSIPQLLVRYISTRLFFARPSAVVFDASG